MVNLIKQLNYVAEKNICVYICPEENCYFCLEKPKLVLAKEQPVAESEPYWDDEVSDEGLNYIEILAFQQGHMLADMDIVNSNNPKYPIELFFRAYEIHLGIYDGELEDLIAHRDFLPAFLNRREILSIEEKLFTVEKVVLMLQKAREELGWD